MATPQRTDELSVLRVCRKETEWRQGTGEDHQNQGLKSVGEKYEARITKVEIWDFFALRTSTFAFFSDTLYPWRQKED